MCVGVSTAPSKTPPPLSCKVPPLNQQTVQALPFWTIPPTILVFREPLPLKVGFFSESPEYQSFSSLISFYLLKVTKFLGKISHFEFSVLTEKNIFAYKLYLPLNISDFNLILM